MERKVKKTSSKAKQLLSHHLLMSCLPQHGFAHSSHCEKELGTQELFVLLSVQTVERVQPHLPGPNHPKAGHIPGPASPGCGAAAPRAVPPRLSRISRHLLPGSHFPSENNRLCKVTRSDWVSSVWPARCESQSAPQNPVGTFSPLDGNDPSGLGVLGGKLVLGSAQRDTGHRW